MTGLDYIFAARPMLHLPLWSIFLASLHYHQVLSGEGFAWRDLGVLVALTLAAAATYYLNQVYDMESDRINDKLGFLQRGLITEKSMMRLYVVLSAAAGIIAAAVSLLTLMIVMVLFVLGYLYSAPPFRLKDRAIGGLLANALGFGFLVPMAVMPDLTFHNAGMLGWDNPFYFMLAVGGVYALTTLPDRKGDEVVGKRTLAVLLPSRVVVLISLALFLLSAWVAWYSTHEMLMYISLAASAGVVLTLVSGDRRFELWAAQIPIFLLTVLAGWFFPVYLLFIVAIVFSARIYYRKRFAVTYPRLI